MKYDYPTLYQILKQLDHDFEVARSRGPGGQSVNRTNSAVVLRFSIATCSLFNDQQKSLLFKKLATKLNQNGELLVRSETERSQLLNKEACVKRLAQILADTLYVQAKRVATRPTFSSQIKRVDSKKKRSHIKSMRQKSKIDYDS